MSQTLASVLRFVLFQTDFINYSQALEFLLVLPEDMEPYRYHLRQKIAEHVEETGSQWGTHLLECFEDYVGKFWLVKPKAADLDRLLSRLRNTD